MRWRIAAPKPGPDALQGGTARRPRTRGLNGSASASAPWRERSARLRSQGGQRISPLASAVRRLTVKGPCADLHEVSWCSIRRPRFLASPRHAYMPPEEDAAHPPTPPVPRPLTNTPGQAQQVTLIDGVPAYNRTRWAARREKVVAGRQPVRRHNARHWRQGCRRIAFALCDVYYAKPRVGSVRTVGSDATAPLSAGGKRACGVTGPARGCRGAASACACRTGRCAVVFQRKTCQNAAAGTFFCRPHG